MISSTASKRSRNLIHLALSLGMLSACGSNPTPRAPIQNQLPNIPGSNSTVYTPGLNSPTCVASDPNHQCIGLKFVSYQDSTRTPVINGEDTLRVVEGINAVWKNCNIAFQLEKYESISPTDRNLPFSPNWKTDSSRIRALFEEKNSFLVVAVGPWSNSTIAVTQMPGSGAHGTLVEQQYAKNALTVGHELGHYMGLLHIRNNTNLMNPYIGTNTAGISEAQCAYARKTNLQYWPQMLRHPGLSLSQN